MLYSKL